MLTERDLNELLEFKSQQSVLSVYLNTDPTEGNAETHRLRLRSMLKEIDMPQDIEIIERFFNHEFDWSGNSVAVFSAAAEDYFRHYTLALPTKDRVRIGNRPYVKPLADLLDAYGGYAIAMVDKQNIRLFAFHLGELFDEEIIKGEEIRRVKHGGGSQKAGRRSGDVGQTNYLESVTERNMKNAAEVATRFFEKHKTRRILLGGSEDNVSQFQTYLPKTWQSLIVATFPISLNAPKEEVLEKALNAGKQVEQQNEAQLVQMVITNAAKGQNGVISLDETLSAVHEGRVHTLIIDRGFRSSGYRCTGCGYITTQSLQQCPFCSKDFETIPDAVEHAVRKVLQSGGDVEILQGDTTLEKYGHIGALLRY